MKKIEAIVRLNRFDKVRDALAEIGVNFFTMKEVKGFGLEKGEKIFYRGTVYDSNFIPRLQLDILTTDERAEEIMDTIAAAAHTGEVGDGRIFVYDVQHVMRIRTKEMGPDAI